MKYISIFYENIQYQFLYYIQIKYFHKIASFGGGAARRERDREGEGERERGARAAQLVSAQRTACEAWARMMMITRRAVSVL